MNPVSFSHLPAGSPWWAFAVVGGALALHIGGGGLGILTGTGAVSVTKGERLHQLFGTAFVAAMLTMAVMGASLAILDRQWGNVGGGAFAAYLVATAWMTVRRRDGQLGLFEKVAAFCAVAIAVRYLAWGVEASLSPGGQLEGYRPALFYTFAVIATFLAALDVQMILRGGLSGTQRLARHLWRMCFAFFFATGSFFLGQQKVMPASWHGSPVLIALGVAPLLVLAYWLVRIRLRSRRRRIAHA